MIQGYVMIAVFLIVLLSVMAQVIGWKEAIIGMLGSVAITAYLAYACKLIGVE